MLCGSIDSSECGEGVSVCRSDGKVMGYTDREGYNSSSVSTAAQKSVDVSNSVPFVKNFKKN